MTATDEQRACPHAETGAEVRVIRLEDVGRWCAEVEINCSRCGLRFRFIGVPSGIAWDRPTASIDATTLIAPIEPETETRLANRATFCVPPQVHAAKH